MGRVEILAVSIYDITVTTIDGQAQTLDAYRGCVLLIVNVASRCAFTGQYAALEALYRRHAAEGFVVLGFPCDQFGHQEPGDEAQIKSFCSLTYGVSFPLFAKVLVKGPDAHPPLPVFDVGEKRLAGNPVNQVELYQVFDCPRWRGSEAFWAADAAGAPGKASRNHAQ